MRGILLDANVVSEAVRPVPDARVLSFLRAVTGAWLSVVVLHELEFGLQRLDAGRRRERLQRALAEVVARYGDRVLSVDREGALLAAVMRVQAQRAGRVLHLADALIAGTAMAHDLAVATRNVGDFEGLDVPVINPWNTA